MTSNGDLPALLTDDLIVPIKVDVAVKGARYVDSFCFKLFDALMTPGEFAARTCADLNLPDSFQHRIAFQIEEQLNSYKEIIALLRSNGVDNEKWLKIISEPIDMLVGLRHNAVDYSDKFTWDLFSTSSGKEPEVFARKTVEDLGLPLDMESAIAFRIRETLLRLVISAAENPDDPEHLFLPSKLSVPSEIVVSLTQPNGTIDMVRNLWSRAKPEHIDTRSVAPQAKLPVNTMTNANTWYTREFVQDTENRGKEDEMEIDSKYDEGQEKNQLGDVGMENVNNSETDSSKGVDVNDVRDSSVENEVNNETTLIDNEVNREIAPVDNEVNSETTPAECKAPLIKSEVTNETSHADIENANDEIDGLHEVLEGGEDDGKKEDANPVVSEESMDMVIETKDPENQ